MLKRLIGWWRARQERRRRHERFLAMMVLLTDSIPGNPPPSDAAKRFVNRTLRKPVYRDVMDRLKER